MRPARSPKKTRANVITKTRKRLKKKQAKQTELTNEKRVGEPTKLSLTEKVYAEKGLETTNRGEMVRCKKETEMPVKGG